MSQPVIIMLSTNAVQLRPGESYELSIEITNNSGVVEQFSLNLTGLDPAWYQLDEPVLNLYPDHPGNKGHCRVWLSLPPEAFPGTYNPVVQVTNQRLGLVTQPFFLTVGTGQRAVSDITLTPENLETKEKVGRFQLDLKNPLNRPLNVSLTATTVYSDTSLRLIPSVVELEPLGEASSTLEVEPMQRNWYKSDQRYDFTIKADNLNSSLEGYLVQSAALPWLQKLVATPLLLAAGLIGPFLLAGLLVGLMLISNSASTNKTSSLDTAVGAECRLPSGVTATLQVNPIPGKEDLTTTILVTDKKGSREVEAVGTRQLPGLYASLLSVSPDGKSLAYVRAREGNNANEVLDNVEIRLLNLEEPNARSTSLVSIPDGYWPARPVWVDNRQLVYVIRNKAKLELRTIDINKNSVELTNLNKDLPLKSTMYYGDPGEDGPLCGTSDNSRLILREAGLTSQTELFLNPQSIKPNVQRPLAPVVISTNATTKELPLAPLGQGACFVETLSQNDPEWYNQYKIGETGCAATTTAMVLNYYGANYTPFSFFKNACWPQSGGTGWAFDLKCQIRNSDKIIPKEDFSWNRLNENLRSAQPTIVELNDGLTNPHYVVVVAGNGNLAATYRVNDPWDGTNYKSLDYFLDKGYQLRSMISYLPSGEPVCKEDRTSLPRGVSFGFTLLSPQDNTAYKQPVNINYQTETDAIVTSTLYSNLGATPVVKDQAIQAEGRYKLTLQSQIQTAIPYSTTVRFIIDSTPPTVTLTTTNETNLTVDPADSTKLVADGKVNLVFSATDNLSGIAKINYQIELNEEQGPELEAIANTIPSLINPGNYSITYWATDFAGNPSDKQVFQAFRINPAKDASPSPASGDNPSVSAGAGGSPSASASAGAGANTGGDEGTLPKLVITPTELTIEANNRPAIFEIRNQGTVSVSWKIPQLELRDSEYLGFSSTSKQIKPGETQSINVTLNKLNYTDKPLPLKFTIVYNKEDVQEINVTANPQPTPTVQFLQPIERAILGGNSVPIRLKVTSTGLNQPQRAIIMAKFIDKAGNARDEPLPEQPRNNKWTANWDISSLPPQNNIELEAFICWNETKESCMDDAAASWPGLAIPNPAAFINLNPNSDKLNGLLEVSAQVTGTVTSITYRMLYKDINGAEAVQSQPGSGPDFAAKLDTTIIPPQTGIRLDVKVCWGSSPENCSGPANKLPDSFTVEAPVIVLNPLTEAEQKNLPVDLKLSGTISKFSKGTFFMVVKAAKSTSATTGAAIPTEDTLTVSPPAPGTNNWSIAIPTGSWPSQEGISFTPKFCWDDNPKGSFCYAAQPISLTAAIPVLKPELAPSFKPPKDLAEPLTIQATPTPLGRANYVKFLVTYNTNLTTPRPLSSLATIVNNYTIIFDSVALGLKPQSSVSLQMQACPSTGACGPSFEVFSNLAVPATLIKQTTSQDSLQAELQAKGPDAPLTVNTIIDGRGVSSILMQINYQTAPFTPNPKPTADEQFVYNKLMPGQPFTTTLDLREIPPQPGVKFSYLFCWGPGELDESARNCTSQDVYTLDIPLPKISAFYLNRQAGTYTVADSQGGLILPVAIASGSTPTINIPLDANVSGGSYVVSVTWKLFQADTNIATSQYKTSVTNDTGPNLTNGIFNLNTGAISTSGALPQANLKIIGYPVWNNSKSEVTYYNSPFTLTVKPLLTSVSLQDDMRGQGDDDFFDIIPADVAATNKLMFNYKTTFKVALTENGTSPLVKRIFLSATYGTGLPTTLNLDNPVAVQDSNGTWTLDWDHTKATSNIPKPTPDDDITLNLQLCTLSQSADQHNTSCTSPDLNPHVTKIEKLKLVGLGFDDYSGSDSGDYLQPSQISPDATYLNSTFNIRLKLKNAIYDPNSNNEGVIKIKKVRLFAYPTTALNISNLPGTLPAKVELLYRNIDTTDSMSSSPAITITGVYWPDDITSLITALKNNQQKISIGVQYCLKEGVANSCNHWSGLWMEQMTDANSPWSATVKGKQAAIITWQPDTSRTCVPTGSSEEDCPLYYDYLQKTIPADANLKINVYIADSTIDLCTKDQPNSNLKLSYLTTGTIGYGSTTDVITDTSGITLTNSTRTAIGNSAGCTFVTTWDKDQIVAAGFPVDKTDGGIETRSVILVAEVISDSNVLSAAKVLTHGSEKQPYIKFISTANDLTPNGKLKYELNLNSSCSITITLLSSTTPIKNDVKETTASVKNRLTIYNVEFDLSDIPPSSTYPVKYNSELGCTVLINDEPTGPSNTISSPFTITNTVMQTPASNPSATATRSPTPKPTNTATTTPKPTSTATATPRPTSTATSTPRPTNTATSTPRPTNTSTSTPRPPTSTPSATPGPTNTATVTPKPPTSTPSPAPTPSATTTPTAPGGTPTSAATPGSKPTSAATPNSTPTSTPTLNGTPSATPGTPTATVSISMAVLSLTVIRVVALSIAFRRRSESD